MLRVDDRGVGGSTGSQAESTSDDFAGDVVAGIAFLKKRPQIDQRKIGLIGHSEGGLIAPLVASRSSDAAFIVMLAGTGLPGDEILYLQGQLIAKAMGVDEKGLKKQLESQKELFEIIKGEPDRKKAAAPLRELIKKAISELSEDRAKGGRVISTRWSTPRSRVLTRPGSASSLPLTRGRRWRRCAVRCLP